MEYTSETYKLSAKLRSRFRKAGKGFTFTSEVKCLDLVYGGQFESTFHWGSTPAPLEEQVESTLKAVINQLEIDGCKWDESTISAIEEELLDRLDSVPIRETGDVIESGVFFEEASGSEGQYYIIITGKAED